MKNRTFLVPVAVAAGALTVTAGAGATLSAGAPDTAQQVVETTGQPTSKLNIPTAPDRKDSFVLTRIPGGTLLAQHDSHASHDSHSSHASHDSHSSHASHSSGGMSA
jgi:hypothetical protein